MQRYVITLILILSFSFTSCSSDDDGASIENNEVVKRLSKIEYYRNGLFFDKVVNYDSENRIESIIVNKYQAGPFYSSISVEYAGNLVSSIIDSTDYPEWTDKQQSFEVTIEDNLILLASEDTNTRIEITHSNGYVNKIIKYSFDYSFIAEKAELQRDSLDNLTSISFNDGSMVNCYSNFDSDKKANSDGVVIDVLYKDYIKVFGLKLTANNPRTTSQSLSGTPGNPRTYVYEYDDEGYIIKTFNPVPNSYTDIFYEE